MKQTAARRAAPVPKKRKKAKTSPIVYVLILALLLLFLVGSYALAVQFYTGRFPNKTTVNGIDVSNMTLDNAKSAVASQIQSYTLTIKEKDGNTETLTARDIGLTYVDNGELDQLLQQFQPAQWVFYYFGENTLTAATDTTYNQASMQAAVEALRCFDKTWYTKAQDACLVQEGDAFVIQPEVEGNELEPETAKAAIQAALDSGATEVDLTEPDCYRHPQVRSDDEQLTSRVEELSKWVSAKITYDFEDNRIETVDAELIGSWISKNEDGELDLDRDKVLEWVKTQLAYQYDTFGLTHTVKTHDGGTVTLKGGDYGWCIAREDTTDDLVGAIKAGKQEELEPQYQYTAENRGVDDIGGTYVEISIDQQTMWCYKDYECVVETPVVTGNTSKGNGTPRGSVWAMDCHKSPATLGTLDTMGYSSYVNFWMAFVGNVGIHDSSWRSEYGGEIYKTNGSHGCVNTPYDAAKQIYQVCHVGTAVVVY